MRKLINIQKVQETPFQNVAWIMSNLCNYDCSFCYPINKRGDIHFEKLDVYRNLVDNICVDYTPTKFIFNGGEPTLYSNLSELFEYIIEKNASNHISMITNGSRTLRWWQEFTSKPRIHDIIFTYHTEQEVFFKNNIDAFVEKINLFHSMPVHVTILFTAPPTNFESTFTAFDYIQQRVGANCQLKPILGSELLPYSAEQLQLFQQYSNVKGKLAATKVYPKTLLTQKSIVTFDDNSTISISDPKDFMLQKLNYFKGMECDIGLNSIVIFGTKIYRGKCRVGGEIATIYDKDIFCNNSVVCDKITCLCNRDCLESKRLLM